MRLTTEERARHVRAILQAATLAAVGGPARRGKWVGYASIPWDALTSMRDGLDGLGVDWRKARVDAGRDKKRLP